MAQFTLTWDNTSIVDNANAIGQRASYKTKIGDGDWASDGFTPANDLDKSVDSVDAPVLLNNIVYQFKVETLCTSGGPTTNDNGVQEIINFSCITPNIDKTHNHCVITIDVAGTDIIAAIFNLRKASDNSLVEGPTHSPRVDDEVLHQVYDPEVTDNLLTPNTNYYFQIELIAIVNNIEVKSSDQSYLGAKCSPYPFTTDVAPICDPITAVDVSSIEIP